MGRKLSPTEADAFIRDAATLPSQKAEVSSSYGLALQFRIAEALGLSVADLLRPNASEVDFQEAVQERQTAEMALTRDCLDLIEAFARVEDPEKRQRLLTMVRDTAQTNEHKAP